MKHTTRKKGSALTYANLFFNLNRFTKADLSTKVEVMNTRPAASYDSATPKMQTCKRENYTDVKRAIPGIPPIMVLSSISNCLNPFSQKAREI